jgi:hypothetical protein
MFYAPGETEPLPIHGTAEAQPYFFHDHDTILWSVVNPSFSGRCCGCPYSNDLSASFWSPKSVGNLSFAHRGMRKTLEVVESGERYNREVGDKVCLRASAAK